MTELPYEDAQAWRKIGTRIATNSMSQVMGTVAAYGLSFLTFVAVARTLGPAAYGDLTAALIYLYIPAVLADVGLTATVVRRISRDAGTTEAVLGASFPLRILISVALVGIFVGLGYALPFHGRARVAILIASVGTLFQLLNVALLPVFQARLAMHWPVASTLAGRAVTLGLTYGAVAAGLGFESFIWASVIGQAFAFLVSAVLVVRIARVRLRPRVDLRTWRSLLRSGIVLGAALAIGQLYFRIDTVLVALLRPARDVGLYGASYKFLELALIGPVALLTSIFPAFSEFLRRDAHRVRRLAQKAFDIGLALSVPAAVLGVAFASELIEISAGRKYLAGAVALKVLAPYLVVNFMLTPALGLLVADGADRSLLWLYAGVLALNVALNVVLIPPYGFEAAAATSVASEAVSLLLITALARRRLGFLPSVRVAPIVVAAGAAMIVAVVLMPGPALAVAAVSTLVYAGVALAAPSSLRDVVGQLAGRAT